MVKFCIRIGLILLGISVSLVLLGFVLAEHNQPEKITYGMSFNTPYARELELNWQETYDAILDELGVRHLRLAAHWDMVEPSRDTLNFTELDYQIARAEEVGAEAVFGVGRRLPRWPECHAPAWTNELSEEEIQEELREYIRAVVMRYKDSPAVTHWQVENEPYLSVFAHEHCGDLDEEFLREEIALVKSIDPSRPVVITDSGNLGTWVGAYQNGDVFGTSVYLYLWNPELGQLRTILPPWWYRAKEGLVELFFEDKETWLIELSVEPWLLKSIIDVDIETQFSRMDVQKFDEILEYASETQYGRQYLWGAEWWYWLLKHDEPDMWERGKELFTAE